MDQKKTTVRGSDVEYEIEQGVSPQLHKKELPDSEFEGEKYRYDPISVAICPTHTRDNWTTHLGYRQETDGTVVCTKCPWGSKVAGYFRVLNDKIFDLRVKAS